MSRRAPQETQVSGAVMVSHLPRARGQHPQVASSESDTVPALLWAESDSVLESKHHILPLNGTQR